MSILLEDEDDDVEISFPLEFVVHGTPVSLSNTGRSKTEWQNRVLKGARTVVPDHKWAASCDLAITIYDFPEETSGGDVDNIIKWIQDALCPDIFLDDELIKRVVAQRFLPADIDKLTNRNSDLPELIGRALALGDPPFVFIRIGDDPLGDAQ